MSRKLNVLIVDDSLIMRVNLVRSLEGLGHNIVFEAVDGHSSIEAYKKYKPDLVTMDITMPDMDGITAVQKIKEFDANANVIMVTSHGQEAMVMNALKSGAKGYILKPVSLEKLREAIGKIFNELENRAMDEFLDEED
ncbi:MAG: response regulator [Helicobacteraceae bacterium]|nr:response regulator [Helicobacteraceae bacterium]